MVNARGAVESNTSEEIERATRAALEAVAKNDDENAAVEAIRALVRLNYVKIPIASAILAFYDPSRFGAIDPNAWNALGWGDDETDWEPEDYGRYLRRIREIAARCGLTSRDVDAALYKVGSTP